ncbi:MAG TPA: hypothetical protein ENF76_02985 [Candidatus Bathyarchaeota archaeon]|nr:hypothetical protein [Candidatus Bathyarchaeota archaeon]
MILETVSDIARKKKSVETKEIADALRKKGKYVKFTELVNKLKMFEGYGFIKREVVSVNNVPKLVWKIYSY